MVPVYWAGTYRHWEPRPEEQNSWSRTKSHMDGHIADIVYGLYRLDFIRAYKDIRPNESAALHANQPMHAQAGLLRWAGGGGYSGGSRWLWLYAETARQARGYHKHHTQHSSVSTCCWARILLSATKQDLYLPGIPVHTDIFFFNVCRPRPFVFIKGPGLQRMTQMGNTPRRIGVDCWRS